MATSTNHLPQDLLKLLFHYEPASGLLIWKIPYGANKIGDHVGYQIARKHGTTPLYVWFGGHQYSVHVLIWIWMTGVPPAVEIDHENRNNNDNRWDNLREATRSQNQSNTNIYTTNKSGCRGVHLLQGRWRAMISIDGKNRHLGYFDTAEDAAAAWKAEADRRSGDFAAS